MNGLNYVLNYEKEHKREKDVILTASEMSSMSDYQLWLLGHKASETFKINKFASVNAIIGNAFHQYAEYILKDNPKFDTERYFDAIVGEHKISGTCDIIEYTTTQEDEASGTNVFVSFADWKTKGSYQAKKILSGDTEQVKNQLSIYRYMYAQENKNKLIVGVNELDDTGYVYMIVTGDAGFFTKAMGGGRLNKYYVIEVPLMSLERTEKFIKYKISVALGEEPVMDCEAWRCDYCRFECKYRMNNVE